MTNYVSMLEEIYQAQKQKFGKMTKDELFKKLYEEINEYQQASLDLFTCDNQANRVNVMLELADIIIVANRLYLEYDDEIAWLIVDKLFNYETAKWVKIKWDMVEKRNYTKDDCGNWIKY